MFLRSFVLSLFLSAASIAAGAATTPRPPVSAPPAMVANVGQAVFSTGAGADHVDAVMEVKGAMAYLHAGGMHIVQERFTEKDSSGLPFMDQYRVDISLLGSNPHARMEVVKGASGFVRYLGPGDGPQGRIAQRFEKVIYRNVYPGIDEVITMTQYGPKVDFIVHPGADPSQIALRYVGAEPELTSEGSLTATTPLGTLTELAPVAFSGDRKVDVAFRVDGASVRFTLGSYDRSRDLVIDPQRVWATYYGGNGATNECRTQIGKTGDLYLIGSTLTRNLPVSPGVLQTRLRARTDAFAAKFTYDGRFVWHTYCGGTGTDMVLDGALDGRDFVWMCGHLDSNDSPLLNYDRSGSGPFGSLDGDTIAYKAGWMLRLDSNGAWGDSWILDGREDDAISGFDIRNDRIAIVGYTKSPRVNEVSGNPFPHDSSNNYRQYDMFVGRLILRTGQGYRWHGEWLSYYGGSQDDWGSQVTINNAGVVTAIGYGQSDNVPTTTGAAYQGSWDSFVLCITTPTANTPMRSWARYLGSSGNELCYDATSDPQGNPVFVGYTSGSDFPTSNAFRTTNAGPSDGFITKYAVANGNYVYSTYLGGNNVDVIRSVAVSPAGNVWVAGRSSSENMPITNDAYQDALYSDAEYVLNDGFFIQFNPAVTTMLYGTFYGAPPQPDLPPIPQMGDPPLPQDTDFGDDEVTGMDVDGDAYIALASRIRGVRFSTTPGAYQDSTALNLDTVKNVAFLTLFSNCPDTAIAITVDGPPTLCRDEVRRLVGPDGFARYLWSNGDSLRITNVADTGTYILITTDFNGCRFRDTVQITRSPLPDVSAGSDVSGCVGKVVTLTATPSGGTPPYTYKWRRIEAGPQFIDNDTLRQPGVNPNSTSRYEVTVTDSAGCTDKDTVLVEVINPLPTFTPATVDFGLLDACATSADDSVKVINPMPYEIQITSSIPDDPRIEVVSALGPNFTIGPNDSAYVVLRVSPGAAGVTNGTITLVGEPCEWKLDVKYRVEKARLLATILPGTLDYGAGASCEAIQKDSFTVIRNGGTDPLVLEVGSVAAPFTILSPTTQRTLQPNDTVHAVIRFAPSADGTYNEVARFPFVSGTCADTLKVTVRGAQQSVHVEAAPGSFDFGTLEGCEDERSDTTVIRNKGTVDITVTLPTSPEVVYEPAGPLQLKAGDSAVVKITIRPATSGPFSQTSNLSIQPCDATLPIFLVAQKNGVAFTTPSQISLGEVNTCTDAATKTTSFTLSFDGTGTSTVESVTVGNELTTTLSAGAMLQSGTPQSFNLSWTPSADGALVDSMVVIFQPCSVRRVIRTTGTRTTPALRAVQAAIPLGAITGDATGTIRFENNGTDTLYVETSASANVVVVDARPGPLQPLLPGAFLEVDYRVLCRDVIDDTIRAFTSAGCILEASTAFTGTCEQVEPVVSATVVIDSAAVEVGDRFNLPIRLTQSTGLNQAGLYNWSAEITYNPMVVVGMGSTPDCFVSGQYAPCTITVTGTRTDTLGVIGELDFTAVLGTAEQTDVVLSSFRWTDDTTVVTTTGNGHILLTDICQEGGIRLLDPKSSAFDIRVYPIPASSTLTIDVRGMGSQPGTWSLGNYVGQIVDSGTLTPDASGNALENVDVRTLASGTYFLTIDARGTVNRMPVLIQR